MQGEGIRDSANVSRSVFDSDEQGAAGSIGESDNGLKHAGRGGEVSFEFECLSLGQGQEVRQIHYSE